MDEAIAGGGRWINPIGIKTANRVERTEWRKDLLNTGELVEIPDHLALQTLNYANPFFTGRMTRQLITIYMDLLGEAPLLKERNGTSAPVGLWPIPPHWVTRMATPQQPTFGVSWGGANVEMPIPEQDVLWMVDPNPYNPYLRGLGTGYTLADEIDTMEAVTKYRRGFFWNSARPDFIMEIDGISKRDLRRYSLGFNASHRGFWKSFKAHFINKVVKLHQLSGGSLRDMELSQLTKDQRDVFVQVIGIPPEKMMIIENSNKATSLAADLTMAKDVIAPRAELQRSYFQEKLMPEYDERLVLDFTMPVVGDPEARLQAMVARPETVRVSEWREMQGLKEIGDENDDLFIVPSVGVRAIQALDELEQDPMDLMGAGIDPLTGKPLPTGDEDDPEDPEGDDKKPPKPGDKPKPPKPEEPKSVFVTINNTPPSVEIKSPITINNPQPTIEVPIVVNTPELKAPHVTVNIPSAKPTKKTVQRDKDGRIVGMTEE
jgi:hypothetical protein